MDTETITLDIPESLYRTAQRVAQATHQSLDVVLQTSIAQGLPPLDDVTEEVATELAALGSLDDGALWQATRIAMHAGEQAEIHMLLDRQATDEITIDEKMRLRDLLSIYGELMVRKAHAYLLLARRGYSVPLQQTPK